jgi:Tfp pilus assembly protein PilO
MIRRVIAIAVVALVLLTVVWYAALDRPENARLKRLDNEQAQVANKVSVLQLQLMALQAQERRAPAERTALSALEQAVPDGPSLDQLIKVINEAADAVGVTITSIGTPAPSGWGASSGAPSVVGTPSLSVSVAVKGSNAEILAFVTALDKARRLFVVTSFGLANNGTGASDTGGNGQGTTLDVEAFYADASSNVPTYPGGP